MCVQVVDHPVIFFHVAKLFGNMVEVVDPIDAGARKSQVPNDFARGHAKRVEQNARAKPNILELDFLGLARHSGLRGVFAMQNLHSGFFIAAGNQLALFEQSARIEI